MRAFQGSDDDDDGVGVRNPCPSASTLPEVRCCTGLFRNGILREPSIPKELFRVGIVKSPDKVPVPVGRLQGAKGADLEPSLAFPL